VDLGQAGLPLRVEARAVEHEQHVVAVVVDLRPLVELLQVLADELVPAEPVGERVDLLRCRAGDVEPENSSRSCSSSSRVSSIASSTCICRDVRPRRFATR